VFLCYETCGVIYLFTGKNNVFASIAVTLLFEEKLPDFIL